MTKIESPKSIGQQHTAALRIATPIANRFHQSTYSTFEIIFTAHDGSKVSSKFVIPLEAAVALEKAGFEIKLVGPLNG